MDTEAVVEVATVATETAEVDRHPTGEVARRSPECAYSEVGIGFP